MTRRAHRISLKDRLRYLLPPYLFDGVRFLKKMLRREPVAWEYMPGGWSAFPTSPEIKGWNVESIVDVYQSRWPAFMAYLQETLPLCVAPERTLPTHLAAGPYDSYDLFYHNNILTYGYVLARAARHNSAISMLDWGGGVGHYQAINHALLPDLEVEYHCKDVPVMAQRGQALFPNAKFYVDDTCLHRTYNFVLASGSFHYSQDWKTTLHGLAAATAGSLFITQLPVVHDVPSYVMIQRPYSHGYNTEYLGWCLHRAEFLEQAEAARLTLVREFICGYSPPIHRAPEPAEYRGYLFTPTGA